MVYAVLYTTGSIYEVAPCVLIWEHSLGPQYSFAGFYVYPRRGKSIQLMSRTSRHEPAHIRALLWT
jgi:hypothetical protein